MSVPDLDKRLAARQQPLDRQPVMHQKWRELLFLHWVCSPQEIQKTLPDGLYVDTFEDQAYVGIVPFFVHGARPRFLPSVPGVSNFLELNVRTYVFDDQSVPGVWFYSLNAGPATIGRKVVVSAARLGFFLPYYLANMSAEKSGKSGAVNEIRYTCGRLGTSPEMASSYRYRPGGDVYSAAPETLDFFLIERYILFSLNSISGKLFRGQVHHQPYPLQTVTVPEWDAHMLTVDGLTCQSDMPPAHLIYSKGVDVEVFALQAAR